MSNTPKIFLLLFVLSIVQASVFASTYVHLDQTATAANDLFCSVDQMTDSEYYSFTWYKNDYLFTSGTNVIPASELHRGDYWACEVYLHGSYDHWIGEDETTILNTAPIITSTPDMDAVVGYSYNYQVTAYDLDNDALTYELVSGSIGMQMNSNGLVIWTPTAEGNFDVTVSVNDGEALSTQTFTIEVFSGVTGLDVTAIANPSSGVEPLTVAFSAVVSGGNSPYAYEWDFDNDGNVDSFSAAPTHTYSSNGTYTARVRVTDNNVPMANAGEDTVTVYVSEQGTIPTLTVSATATPISGIRPLVVSFSATSFGGIGGYTYSWNFGDSTTSTLQNPSHTYNSVGTYNARVTVTSGLQIVSSDYLTIVVSQNTSVITFTTGSCPNGQVNENYTCDINANGPGTITFTLVSGPANMTINSNTGVVSWLPTNDGTYSFTVGAASGSAYGTRTFTIVIEDEEENDDEDANSDDLFIESIKFDSDVVQQGTELVGYITLENEGDYDMDDLTIEMSIDDLDISETTSKFDLNDGKKETYELSMYLPSTVEEGYYFVKFVVENDDIRVTKYSEIYVKGTKANVVDTTANNVVVQSSIQSYVPPAGKARVNWLGIWVMVILFLALLALTIYLAKHAMKKEEKVEIKALDNELI